jgi:hypothetical protein
LRHQQNVARNPSHKDLRYKPTFGDCAPVTNLVQDGREPPTGARIDLFFTMSDSMPRPRPLRVKDVTETCVSRTIRTSSLITFQKKDTSKRHGRSSISSLVIGFRWRSPKATGSTFRLAPKNGGARRDRTDDLLLAKQALSQLSYGPG